jgi:hypothetical protein
MRRVLSISRLTMLTMKGEIEKLIETRDLLVLESNTKLGTKREALANNTDNQTYYFLGLRKEVYIKK